MSSLRTGSRSDSCPVCSSGRAQVRHVWCSQFCLLNSWDTTFILAAGTSSMALQLDLAFWSSQHLISVEDRVPRGNLASLPSCFPAGQGPAMRFSSQWSVNNSGMYCLWEHNETWPEKACSDYYNHNNLYSKELGKEGRGMNKKARRQRGRKKVRQGIVLIFCFVMSPGQDTLTKPLRNSFSFLFSYWKDYNSNRVNNSPNYMCNKK